MNITIDPHVHYYKEFDKNNFFPTLSSNLKKLSPSKNDLLGFVLVSTSSNHLLDEMKNYNEEELSKWSIKEIIDFDNYLKIKLTDQTELLAFYGYQFNTTDKIEVLNLFSKVISTDINHTDIYHTGINHSGGIYAINWAPGKWLGRRGKIIQSYIDSAAYQPLFSFTKLFSDNIILRYLLGGELLIKSRKNKLPIGGSDPLPIKGDYVISGSIGIYIKELSEILAGEISGEKISVGEIIKKINSEEFINLSEKVYSLDIIKRIFKYELKRRSNFN